jgi:hypothetical protein
VPPPPLLPSSHQSLRASLFAIKQRNWFFEASFSPSHHTLPHSPLSHHSIRCCSSSYRQRREQHRRAPQESRMIRKLPAKVYQGRVKKLYCYMGIDHCVLLFCFVWCVCHCRVPVCNAVCRIIPCRTTHQPLHPRIQSAAASCRSCVCLYNHPLRYCAVLLRMSIRSCRLLRTPVFQPTDQRPQFHSFSAMQFWSITSVFHSTTSFPVLFPFMYFYVIRIRSVTLCVFMVQILTTYRYQSSSFEPLPRRCIFRVWFVPGFAPCVRSV